MTLSARSRLFLAVFAPLALLFVLTSQGNVNRLSPDPVAAGISAWSVAERGTLDVAGRELPENPWLLKRDGKVLSNRTPGVIAVGIPAAAVAAVFTDDFTLWPERITGALTSAAAAGVLALLLLELGATRRQAGVFAFLAALATGTWAVSSDGQWTHGPDQLLLLLALLLVARDHLWRAGLVLAAAATVRLHLLVVAVVLGLGLAVVRRDLRPALRIGLPAALGPLAVLVYGKAVFGLWSLSPGYAAIGQPTGEFISGSKSMGAGHPVLVNVAGSLLSPDRGLLTISPVVLVLLLRAVPAWRATPVWGRLAVIGGVGYWLVQCRLNHFTGGLHFYGYRLVLEPLTLLAPLLWASWSTRIRGSGFERAVLSTLVLSIGSQVLGALWVWPDGTASEWRHSYVVEVFDTDLYPAVVGPFVFAVLIAAAVVVLKRPAARPASPREAQLAPS